MVLLRLRKPLSYYREKYGTELYGLSKLYLMMEKEHNRGQEGAGVGCVKLDTPPGQEYIFRERAEGADAIQTVFSEISRQMQQGARSEHHSSDTSDITAAPFVGECYMGHLRYSTTGRSGISNVHPFMRRNNWRARNLLLCGNFNLTNVDEIFAEITALGQHPRYYSDGFIMLEQIGHALDRENERLYARHHAAGLTGLALSDAISRDIDQTNVLHRCAPHWDGGYVMCGITGNGDMWSMRDPGGIRPAFWYADEEIIVLASERPVIQTAFHLDTADIRELKPGEALVVDRDGSYKTEQVLLPAPGGSKCSFERIYFSRGNDADIYNERKQLGALLADSVSEAVGHDIAHTLFSFIPNTAEVAYMGLTGEFNRRLARQKLDMALRLQNGEQIPPGEVEALMLQSIKAEKVAWKDIKLRTFIAQSGAREDLASHVYDITYGTIRPHVDNLVVIDDSIVRGTTLRQSIISILDRLKPKKIVIVSSSPQVRYPDCYGIDMSRLGEFIAFRAAMALLEERGMAHIARKVYEQCLAAADKPKEEQQNYVKAIYEPFTEQEISAKITEMLTPPGTEAEVEIVYQTIEGLHKAVPHHTGDWYFSGDYPTPGGIKLVNRAFVNYYQGDASKR